MELIDLNGASAGDLRKYLLDNFGIEKAANTARDKLVAEILEQEQAIGVARSGEAVPDEAVVSGVMTPQQREINKSDRVKIKIARDPNSNGNDDVTVGINGVVYLIKREVVADVPRPVYEVLMQAQEVRYNQRDDGTLVPVTVQSYPTSLVG